MKKEEIKLAVESLAKSQGFYGRLIQALQDEDKEDEFYQICEKQNFNDIVDFVMWIES